MSTIVLIGTGAILLSIGVGIGYWWGTTGRKVEADRASRFEKELEEYRGKVTDHFRQTAEQFQVIGREYRKLYEHMAGGAAALCDTGQMDERLTFPTVEILPKEVSPAAGMQDDESQAKPPADFAPPASAEEPEAGLAVPEAEPSDDELRHTEAVEELLTEHELARDEEEAGKTYH
jgi:uncharacterized membrane-anchored protein YhcB (DUF1043 family)